MRHKVADARSGAAKTIKIKQTRGLGRGETKRACEIKTMTWAKRLCAIRTKPKLSTLMKDL